MWETVFDPSMLVGSNVIVYCPDAALAEELMGVLAENGITWCWNGEVPNKCNTRWSDYGEYTCYWIEDGCIAYGDRGCAEDYASGSPDYIRCTFFGTEAPDFDTASDALTQSGNR